MRNAASLYYLQRLGCELFNQMPKATKGTGGNRFTTAENREIPSAGKFSSNESKDNEEPPQKPKPKLEVAADMGFNKNQVAQFQKLADNPDAVQDATLSIPPL